MHGEAELDRRGPCGSELSTQWGTTVEALPPAHAGVAAGSQIFMHTFPWSVSHVTAWHVSGAGLPQGPRGTGPKAISVVRRQ